MGSTAGAAIIARPRLLGPAEAPFMLISAVLLLGVAALTFLFPRTMAYIAAACFTWLALTLVAKVIRLRLARNRRQPPTPSEDGS